MMVTTAAVLAASGSRRMADVLISRFRWAVIAGAILHVAFFRDPLALGITVLMLVVNLLPGVLQHRSERLLTLLQLGLDLAAVVLVLASIGAPVVWALLLLPVTEGAVRAQRVGALGTWFVGQVAVTAVVGPDVSGNAVLSQLSVFAATVAIGLVSWQLESRLFALHHAQQESDRRALLLTAVAGAARTVTALDPQRVLEAVTEAALELGFDMAEIETADHTTRQLVPVVQRGWPEHHPPTPQAMDEGVGGAAFISGQMVVVDDYQQWTGAMPIHLQTGIARSAAGVPIVVDGETVAVLCVANRVPRQATSYERDCLELLAMQAGVALRNAQIHDERREQQRILEHQATHDTLTGVANRAHLIDVLSRRLASSPTSRSRATVLFVDLDGFKDVNDDLGHMIGDQLLVAVAERLSHVVRPSDLVARYGGDEFVVLLDHTPKELEAIAARILDAIAQPLQLEGDLVIPGASIGVATEEPGDDVDRLLLRADEAMYRAKQAGRGRISH